jgi:hypothetical protein
MANIQAILNKITRNMEQRGYWNPSNSPFANPNPPTQVTEGGNGTEVLFTKSDSTVLTVTYVLKQIQSPMGGVDPTVSPYLGIGIAAPGSLQIKGAAGQNTIAAIFTDAGSIELMVELAGYGNDLIIQAGDSTTQLARIRGLDSWLGLGS